MRGARNIAHRAARISRVVAGVLMLAADRITYSLVTLVFIGSYLIIVLSFILFVSALLSALLGH